MKDKVYLVIPVYNHSTTLPLVVEEAQKYSLTIIVVDDGSTEKLAEALPNLPVIFVRHQVNQGKGQAICTGAKRACELGASHIITMDADGQHKAQDLPAFLAAIAQNPSAIILGLRDFSSPNIPKASRFGRKFSQFWMLVQTGLNIRDMQTGFRAYPLEIFEKLNLTSTGYDFEIEVLVKAAWAGYHLLEIPVAVDYPKDRRSHFRLFYDNAAIALLNTKLTVRALLPLPFTCKLENNQKLSLSHPWQSLKQLVATKASPKELGYSAGLAITISTLPFLGLQSILLLLAIGCFHLNRLTALWVVPLTWPPLVPAIAVLLGYRLRHGSWLSEFSLETLGYECQERFLEWIYGSLVLAPALGLFFGLLIFVFASLIFNRKFC
ncbi:MAG: glycosyltransferase family 2 protein [Desulfovibrio sp.]|nr:glycosyltransferase family 2 protein [Desulfovibrio sp.]